MLQHGHTPKGFRASHSFCFRGKNCTFAFSNMWSPSRAMPTAPFTSPMATKAPSLPINNAHHHYPRSTAEPPSPQSSSSCEINQASNREFEMEPTKSPAVGKRLWNFLRVAFFMLRKGFISKRKLIIDMNLMMKRGRLMGKSWAKNLAFNHRPTVAPPIIHPGSGRQEYEFSCGSSPDPAFFQAIHNGKRRHHAYFPCIGAIVEDDGSTAPDASPALPSIEYLSHSFNSLAPGETLIPLPSPLSVRVSNYSSDDEDVEVDGDVDNDAEEFIRRFYEQLQAQNRMQLLQYEMNE